MDSFELNKNYSVVEVKTPDFLVGKTIKEVGFRKNHSIVILTIIKQTEETGFLGKSTVTTVQGIPQLETILEKDDILVLYGSNKDLSKITKITRE